MNSTLPRILPGTLAAALVIAAAAALPSTGSAAPAPGPAHDHAAAPPGHDHPAPGAGAPAPGRAPAGVAPPTSLPAGTPANRPGLVQVTVLDGSTRTPVPNHPIQLAAFIGSSPISVDGTTDAMGIAVFDVSGLPGGTTLLARTDYKEGRYIAGPSPLPPMVPLSLELVVYEGTSSPEAIAIVEPSRIGLHPYEQPRVGFTEKKDLMLRVTVETTVANDSGRAYFPTTPLQFPLPDGATEVEFPGSVWMTREAGAVVFRGYLPPGRTIMGYSFSMPLPGGSAEISLLLPFPASGVELISTFDRESARLEGTGFGPAESTKVRGGGNLIPVMRATAAHLDANVPIIVTLGGVPDSNAYPEAGLAVVFGLMAALMAAALLWGLASIFDRAVGITVAFVALIVAFAAPGWLAPAATPGVSWVLRIGIVAAFAAAFFVGRRIPRHRIAEPKESDTALQQRKDKLIEQLCKIEEGRIDGRIHPDRYQRIRQDLVDRVAAIERRLEA